MERIKKTLENTTQFFCVALQKRMKQHYKTRFPAANVSHMNEDVATNTIVAKTLAHDNGIMGHGGCTKVQVYTGIKSHMTDIFPMKNKDDLPETLLEYLRKQGAPNNLKLDNAGEVTGKEVTHMLNQYRIC